MKVKHLITAMHASDYEITDVDFKDVEPDKMTVSLIHEKCPKIEVKVELKKLENEKGKACWGISGTNGFEVCDNSNEYIVTEEAEEVMKNSILRFVVEHAAGFIEEANEEDKKESSASDGLKE